MAKRARALYQTGQSFYAEDKFAEAHGYYERTFLAYSQFSDWSARAYLADAEALIAMGSKADALKTLEEALTTLPKTIDAPVLESIKLKIHELQLDTPIKPILIDDNAFIHKQNHRHFRYYHCERSACDADRSIALRKCFLGGIWAKSRCGSISNRQKSAIHHTQRISRRYVDDRDVN